jgi:hypothetical protein
MKEPWPTLIQSAVAIAAVAASYFLGRKQGKDQFRHQQGAQAAAEVMRRMAEIRRTIYLLKQPETKPKMKVLYTLMEQKGGLAEYVARTYWLDRHISMQVVYIVECVETFRAEQSGRRRRGEPVFEAEAVEGFDKEIGRLHAELRRMIDRYMGTGESFWHRVRRRWRE